MPTQIMLIAPADADAASFAPMLDAALGATPIAALLLPRGTRSEGAYKALVKAVAPKAQKAGAAVLIEGEPGLVRTLGVDGLHVSSGSSAVRAAIDALQPDYIVGAANLASRHDAMSQGELAPDYVFFGPLSGTRDPEQREMARWWSELMTVPAVLSDPAAVGEAASPEGCEFIALGDSLWAAPNGVASALQAIVDGLKAAA